MLYTILFLVLFVFFIFLTIWVGNNIGREMSIVNYEYDLNKSFECLSIKEKELLLSQNIGYYDKIIAKKYKK